MDENGKIDRRVRKERSYEEELASANDRKQFGYDSSTRIEWDIRNFQILKADILSDNRKDRRKKE